MKIFETVRNWWKGRAKNEFANTSSTQPQPIPVHVEPETLFMRGIRDGFYPG
jgi:hypothetical protein